MKLFDSKTRMAIITAINNVNSSIAITNKTNYATANLNKLS